MISHRTRRQEILERNRPYGSSSQNRAKVNSHSQAWNLSPSYVSKTTSGQARYLPSQPSTYYAYILGSHGHNCAPDTTLCPLRVHFLNTLSYLPNRARGLWERLLATTVMADKRKSQHMVQLVNTRILQTILANAMTGTQTTGSRTRADNFDCPVSVLAHARCHLTFSMKLTTSPLPNSFIPAEGNPIVC